jgi:hypothetical protein
MLTAVVLRQATGVMEVTAGAGRGAVIVNPSGSVPFWPSGFVTLTVHAPAVRLRISNVQVIFTGDSTNTPVPGMSASPARVRLTDAPPLKFDPASSVIVPVVVLRPPAGVMAVMAGAGAGMGAVIVNPSGRVPNSVSLLLTTTFQVPAGLPVRSNVQVIFPPDSTTTDVPGMAVSPARVRFTTDPGTKPVPARSVIETVVVLTPVAGVILMAAGVSSPADPIQTRISRDMQIQIFRVRADPAMDHLSKTPGDIFLNPAILPPAEYTARGRQSGATSAEMKNR